MLRNLICCRTKRQLLGWPVVSFTTLLQHCYSGLFATRQGHHGAGSTYLPLQHHHHHHQEIMLLPLTLNRLHTLLLGNQFSSPHPLHAPLGPPHKRHQQPPLCSSHPRSWNALPQRCTSNRSEAGCWGAALDFSLRNGSFYVWRGVNERTVRSILFLCQRNLKTTAREAFITLTSCVTVRTESSCQL